VQAVQADQIGLRRGMISTQDAEHKAVVGEVRKMHLEMSESTSEIKGALLGMVDMRNDISALFKQANSSRSPQMDELHGEFHQLRNEVMNLARPEDIGQLQEALAASECSPGEMGEMRTVLTDVQGGIESLRSEIVSLSNTITMRTDAPSVGCTGSDLSSARADLPVGLAASRSTEHLPAVRRNRLLDPVPSIPGSSSLPSVLPDDDSRPMSSGRLGSQASDSLWMTSPEIGLEAQTQQGTLVSDSAAPSDGVSGNGRAPPDPLFDTALSDTTGSGRGQDSPLLERLRMAKFLTKHSRT